MNPTPDKREQHLLALIAFHKRAEAAFLAIGKVQDAESARKMAEQLQKELDRMVEERR